MVGLEKLWCCVGGDVKHKIESWWPIYLINSVDNSKISINGVLSWMTNIPVNVLNINFNMDNMSIAYKSFVSNW